MADRYVKHHKIAFFGDLTLPNCLDWCVVLCVTSWLGLTLFQLGGARPDALVMSSCFLGLALLLHTLCLLADSPRSPFRIHPLGFLFFPALAYIALNVYFWSPYAWKGKEELLLMVQGVALFWLTMQNFQTRGHVWFFLLALVGMACTGVLLGMMQFFHRPDWLPPLLNPLTGEVYNVKLSEQYHGRASGFFGAPTSYAGFLLLVAFPLLVAGFSRRFTPMMRMFCIYAGAIMLGAIFLSMSRGAILLLLFGLFLLPLICRGKLKMFILVWGVGGLLLVGTFTLLFTTNDDFRERVDTAVEIGGEASRPVMWEAAWQQFLAAPILGNGVGGYEYLFEDQRPEGFNRSPSHAHNDFLETLADQGIVGLLLFWGPVGFIAFLAIKEWFNQPDVVRISGLDARGGSLRVPTPKFFIGSIGLGLLLFSAHLLLEFHLRTPGLLMLFFIMLGLLAKCVPMERIELKRSFAVRASLMSLGLALAMLIPLWAIPQYTALMYVQNGRRMMTNVSKNLEALKRDEVYFNEMLATLREGVRRSPGNADAWSDLSNAVVTQDYMRPGLGKAYGQEAEPYARNSLKINPRHPQAWINLGNSLTLQGRMVEAGEAYRKATEIAPNRADVWYFYAGHLNLLASTREQALEAIERSLKLEPGNEEAVDLRRKILVP